MTKKQLIESKIREIVKEVLNELSGTPLTTTRRKLELFIYTQRNLAKTNPEKLLNVIKQDRRFKGIEMSDNEIMYLIKNSINLK